jgi:hypothetical protein
MNGRRWWHDLLDWYGRNRNTIHTATLIAAIFAAGAILIGAVTPAARGDMIVTGATVDPGVGNTGNVPASSSPATTGPVAPVTTPPPAVRLNNAQPVTPTTPPSVGLFGLPYAPIDLSPRDEVSFYRQQFGPDIAPYIIEALDLEGRRRTHLIAHFDGLAFRESSYRNDVSTWCCHGYWQIYVSQALADRWLGPRFATCDIDEIDDVLGNDPIDKQRNACAALLIYSYQGGGAWDAW